MEVKLLNGYNEISNAFFSISDTFINFDNEVDINSYLNKISDLANVYVVLEDETITGFCAVYMNDIYNAIAYITLFGVKKDLKQTGIGTYLFTHIEQAAVKNKMKVLRLEVKKSNLSAISFYKKMGMTEYKNNETSIFLTKEL